MFGWVFIINIRLLRSVFMNNIIIDMQYLCDWHLDNVATVYTPDLCSWPMFVSGENVVAINLNPTTFASLLRSLCLPI